MSKLPDHYPAWWCCPVGKPRVVKEMEDNPRANVQRPSAEVIWSAMTGLPMVPRQWLWPSGSAWLTPGAVESIGLVPPGSAEP